MTDPRDLQPGEEIQLSFPFADWQRFRIVSASPIDEEGNQTLKLERIESELHVSDDSFEKEALDTLIEEKRREDRQRMMIEENGGQALYCTNCGARLALFAEGKLTFSVKARNEFFCPMCGEKFEINKRRASGNGNQKSVGSLDFSPRGAE